MDISKKNRIKNQNLSYNIPRNTTGNNVTLAVLRDLKNRLEKLNTKISILERKLETIPKNTISGLYEHYQDGETSSETNFYSELAKLNSRLTELEKKIEKRIPERVLSESIFKEEAQDSEQLGNKIISEIKDLMSKKPVLKDIEAPLTIVERKRIEHIISLLKRHEKLTSSELSDMMGLSRTRCNEYFKIMENLKMVEAILSGREKYYKLKT